MDDYPNYNYPVFTFSLGDDVPVDRWPTVYCVDESTGRIHYPGYGHGGDDWTQGWDVGSGGTEQMYADHLYTVIILVYESVPIQSSTPLKYAIIKSVSPSYGEGTNLGTISFLQAEPLTGVVKGEAGKQYSFSITDKYNSLYPPFASVPCNEDGSFTIAGLLDGEYWYSVYANPGKTYVCSGSFTVDLNNRNIEIVIPHYHNWDAGAIEKEASCMEVGIKVYHCSGCEETRTEELPKLSHILDDGIDSDAPTCTETGTHASTCQRCGNIITTSIPALGHNWGTGAVKKEATCTEAGVIEFTCSRCGETKTETKKALGHLQKAGWESNSENHWHVCSRCGQILDGSYHAHTFYNGQCTGCGRYLVSYDITFETNGADQVIPSQNIKGGLTVSEPSSITKEHYHLDGWCSNKELTVVYDFSSPVNENMTLYAKWSYSEIIPGSGVYYPGYWATFTWKDPDYEGFDHCVVAPGGFEWAIEMGGGTTIAAGTQSYTITGTLVEEYLYVCTVDSKGNISQGVQIPVTN